MTTGWIDGNACTLPSVEQPLRLAEFDAVFGEAVRRVELVNRTTTRLTLEGPAGLAQRVSDLADRESACCSFFTFGVVETPTGTAAEALTLDITVPDRHAAVLTALTERATAAARRSAREEDGT